MRYLIIALALAASPLTAADSPAGGAATEVKTAIVEDQDTAIAELKKLNGKITMEGKVAVAANLADIKMTDAGLVHLDALTDLKQLTLRHSYGGVTAVGLAHIMGLKKLTNLDLWDCPPATNDELMKRIATELPQLKELSVGGTPVSDAGLVHLQTMVNLVNLDVWDTKVTAEGLKKFHEALPKCKIRLPWGLRDLKL